MKLCLSRNYLKSIASSNLNHRLRRLLLLEKITLIVDRIHFIELYYRAARRRCLTGRQVLGNVLWIIKVLN